MADTREQSCRRPREDDWLHALDRYMTRRFWRTDPPQRGPAAWAEALVQVIYVSLRNSLRHRLPFQANALTFISLLALVPALAISFSVAKGLGFSSPLRDFLLHNEFVAGQQEVLQRIVGYVENTQVGTLGAVGLVALVLTLVLTISSVEETFNRIWQVPAQRNWLRKFTDYLSVLVICPLLVLGATGAWAAFSSHDLVRWVMGVSVVGEVFSWVPALGPWLMLSAAFVFIYIFLPNTRIPFSSAIISGVVASFLWYLVQSLYIYFQIGVARYNAIYGGFASLPLFMIWMQVSWMVLLFGAELAHAHHVVRHGPLPRFLSPPLTPAQYEALALSVMFRMARRFLRGGPAWSQELMAQALAVPEDDLLSVVCLLEEAGLVAEVTREGLLQPARSLAAITPAQVLAAVRGDGQAGAPAGQWEVGEARVRELLERALSQGREELSGVSLLELAQAAEAEDAAVGQGSAAASADLPEK